MLITRLHFNRILCWVVAFCLGLPAVTAQPFSEISDVMNLAEKATSDAAKCDTLLKYSHQYFMKSRSDLSMVLLNNALETAKSAALNDKLVPIYTDLARCWELKKDFDKAIDYSHRALRFIDDDTQLFRGRLYQYLGRYHRRQKSSLDSMMYYYTLAESFYEENEKYRLWTLYEDWHQAFIEIGDVAKANELLMKAYAITKPMGTRMDHGLILYRLRQIAVRSGDMAALARHTKEYYELVEKTGGDVNNLVHGLEIPEGLTPQEEIAQKEQLLNESNKIKFTGINQSLIGDLAHLYVQTKQYNKALSYALKLDTTGQEIIYKQDVYKLMFDIYSGLGRYKEAAQTARELMAFQKEVNEQVKKDLIYEFEVKYETEKKEHEIALLEASDEVKSLQLLRARNEKWLLIFGLAFLLGIVGIVVYLNRNIKQKNRIIEQNLKEKDVLLREIHHRVKNNLQVVTSLLSLQSNYVQDDKALKAIIEGKNRVSSMALIHQNLYSHENLTFIETADYFSELIENLFDSYNIGEGQLQLEKKIQSMDLDVDTMIPVGLIANELISNALKHAFEGRSGGVLRVVLEERDGILTLEVSDDGIGIDENAFFNSSSFGNRMIKAFQSKLDASVSIVKKGGTTFTVSIRKYTKAAA